MLEIYVTMFFGGICLIAATLVSKGDKTLTLGMYVITAFWVTGNFALNGIKGGLFVAIMAAVGYTIPPMISVMRLRRKEEG